MEYLMNDAIKSYCEFLEKEQVWAFIHLMIESIEGQNLNIFKKRGWIYCMKKFQHGMSKIVGNKTSKTR